MWLVSFGYRVWANEQDGFFPVDEHPAAFVAGMVGESIEAREKADAEGGGLHEFQQLRRPYGATLVEPGTLTGAAIGRSRRYVAGQKPRPQAALVIAGRGSGVDGST